MLFNKGISRFSIVAIFISFFVNSRSHIKAIKTKQKMPSQLLSADAALVPSLRSPQARTPCGTATLINGVWVFADDTPSRHMGKESVSRNSKKRRYIFNPYRAAQVVLGNNLQKQKPKPSSPEITTNPDRTLQDGRLSDGKQQAMPHHDNDEAKRRLTRDERTTRGLTMGSADPTTNEGEQQQQEDDEEEDDDGVVETAFDNVLMETTPHNHHNNNPSAQVSSVAVHHEAGRGFVRVAQPSSFTQFVGARRDEDVRVAVPALPQQQQATHHPLLLRGPLDTHSTQPQQQQQQWQAYPVASHNHVTLLEPSAVTSTTTQLMHPHHQHQGEHSSAAMTAMAHTERSQQVLQQKAFLVRFKFSECLYSAPMVTAGGDEDDGHNNNNNNNNDSDSDREGGDKKSNNREGGATNVQRKKRCDPYAVGDLVVVEGDRGENIGVICEIGDCDDLDRLRRLPRLLRHCMNKDRKRYYHARRKDAVASRSAQQYARDLGLPMNILDAEFQIDLQKLTLYYRCYTTSKTAQTKAEVEGQVDFRQLQRSLYKLFRCRIWLVNWDSDPRLQELVQLQMAASGGGAASATAAPQSTASKSVPALFQQLEEAFRLQQTQPAPHGAASIPSTSTTTSSVRDVDWAPPHAPVHFPLQQQQPPRPAQYQQYQRQAQPMPPPHHQQQPQQQQQQQHSSHYHNQQPQQQQQHPTVGSFTVIGNPQQHRPAPFEQPQQPAPFRYAPQYHPQADQHQHQPQRQHHHHHQQNHQQHQYADPAHMATPAFFSALDKRY